MTRRTRIVTIVATVAAAAALGVAPAATAGSPRAHAAHPAHTAPASPAHGQAQPSKVDRRLSTAKALAAREVARKDLALARVVASSSLALVDAADADTVRASVAADRATLATLGDSAVAAPTLSEVLAVAARVAQVRPETYSIVLSTLLTVTKQEATVVAQQAQSADLALQADALEADGVDVTSVRVPLDAVAAANVTAVDAATAAHDLALAMTATSPLQARSAVGQQLAKLVAAVTTANRQLALARTALAALQAPAV